MGRRLGQGRTVGHRARWQWYRAALDKTFQAMSSAVGSGVPVSLWIAWPWNCLLLESLCYLKLFCVKLSLI